MKHKFNLITMKSTEEKKNLSSFQCILFHFNLKIIRIIRISTIIHNPADTANCLILYMFMRKIIGQLLVNVFPW